MHKALPRALLVLLVAFCFYTGKLGLDFGKHWDEDRIVGQLENTFKSGTFLADFYMWPSLCYDLALVALAPEMAQTVRAEHNFTPGLFAKTKTLPYRIRLRTIFLALSCLTPIWIYLFVLLWRRSDWEALSAAAIFGASWEWHYQARWVTGDCLMMMFAMLGVLLAYAAWKKQRDAGLWLCGSAVAFGLATASKYPAAIGMMIPFFTFLLIVRQRPFRHKLLFIVLLGIVFTATFLLISPGTYLRPLQFLKDMHFTNEHYSTGHRGYTVQGGSQHWIRLIKYLGGFGLSFYVPLAALFAAAAVAGLVAVLRRDRMMLLWLVLLPGFYMFFFASHRVMIIRNYLVILPFMAIFAAHGFAWLFSKLRPAPVHDGAVIILSVLILLNASWLYRSGASIRDRTQIDERAGIINYVNQHQKQTFAFSPQAAQLLGADATMFNNAASTGTAQRLIVNSTEFPNIFLLPCNLPGHYDQATGSWDCNLKYYQTWLMPHFMAIDMSLLRERFLWPPNDPRVLKSHWTN